MITLSTGDPSTLGSYLKLTNAYFGPDSPQAEFLIKKIYDSPHGDEEEVIADERQMILLLMCLGQ